VDTRGWRFGVFVFVAMSSLPFVLFNGHDQAVHRGPELHAALASLSLGHVIPGGDDLGAGGLQVIEGAGNAAWRS